MAMKVCVMWPRDIVLRCQECLCYVKEVLCYVAKIGCVMWQRDFVLCCQDSCVI